MVSEGFLNRQPTVGAWKLEAVYKIVLNSSLPTVSYESGRSHRPSAAGRARDRRPPSWRRPRRTGRGSGRGCGSRGRRSDRRCATSPCACRSRPRARPTGHGTPRNPRRRTGPPTRSSAPHRAAGTRSCGSPCRRDRGPSRRARGWRTRARDRSSSIAPPARGGTRRTKTSEPYVQFSPKVRTPAAFESAATLSANVAAMGPAATRSSRRTPSCSATSGVEAKRWSSRRGAPRPATRRSIRPTSTPRTPVRTYRGGADGPAVPEHDDVDAGRRRGDLAGAREPAGDVKQPDDHARTLGAQRADGRARRRRRIRDGHARRRRPPLPREVQDAEHAHGDLAGADDPVRRKQRSPVSAHDVRRHDRHLRLVAQGAPLRSAQREVPLPDRDCVDAHAPVRPQREARPGLTRRRVDEARLVVRRRRDVACVDLHHRSRREPRPIDPASLGARARRRRGAAMPRRPAGRPSKRAPRQGGRPPSGDPARNRLPRAGRKRRGLATSGPSYAGPRATAVERFINTVNRRHQLTAEVPRRPSQSVQRQLGLRPRAPENTGSGGSPAPGFDCRRTR